MPEEKLDPDKIKLQVQVDNLYISPQYFEKLEASKLEALMMSQLQKFKDWAYKEINKL